MTYKIAFHEDDKTIVEYNSDFPVLLTTSDHITIDNMYYTIEDRFFSLDSEANVFYMIYSCDSL
jgi:hypothetical protein